MRKKLSIATQRARIEVDLARSSVACAEFDEKSHLYRHDGRVLPSVTQVLAATGAYDWLDRIPADRREFARVRGDYVHKASVLIDEGRLDWDKLDPELRPYCEAYAEWRENSGFRAAASEKRLVNLRYGYAGTLDRAGSVVAPSPDSALPALVDLKSGIFDESVGLQLAGYSLLFDALTVPFFLRFGLYLKRNGKFEMKEIPARDFASDRAAFLGSLSLYNWKRRHDRL